MRNLLLATALLLSAGTVCAQIEVSTFADLDNVRNDLSADYILVNDIDASATADPGYNDGEGWMPIGRVDATATPFTGTFDGQGFTISGLMIDRPQDSVPPLFQLVGLFGSVGSSAVVSNLHLVEVDITGESNVGGIAGRLNDSAMMVNCSVSGIVRGEFNTGGLVGTQFDGTVEDCWSEGEVEVKGSVVGGLIGITYSTIRRSFSTSNVRGGDWVGGLVGRVSSGSTIEECFAAGTATSTSGLAGGLAGANGGLILRSYATGDAIEDSGFGSFGGLVGRQDSTALLIDSFARGNVTGPSRIGGAVGGQSSGATMTRCFSTGMVDGNSEVGGLIGRHFDATVTASYWDTVTSGTAISDGGAEVIGLTTAQMTTPFSGGAYNGWDFVNVWLEEADANDGYPIHQWQAVRHTLHYATSPGGSIEGNLQQVRIPGLSGTTVTAIPDNIGFEFVEWSDGSTDNPRTDLKVLSDVNVTAVFVETGLVAISTLADLDNIRNDLNGDYILMNDIDASATADPEYNGGEGWLPIGRVGGNVAIFQGSLDGQGFTIDGLTINRPQASGTGLGGGVIGLLGGSGQIGNVHLSNVNITGHNRVGGLAGEQGGSALITNCSVTGGAAGEFVVGGLIGFQSGGVIENCWTEGEVETFGFSRYAGGLVGQTSATIRNSYSTSDVSGADWVGGLVGWVEGNGLVEECFAAGDVTGTSSLIGGLIGAQSGVIDRCYATGNATIFEGGSGSAGGLVGRQDALAKLHDSFARGNATGPNRIGGVVGFQRDGGSFSRCFSTGIPTGNTAIVGGLLGSQDIGSVTASYWDTDTSGTATSAGGAGAIGLTTAQMTTPYDAGAYSGWNFDVVWLEEDDANDGYPIHQWQTVRHTLQYTAGPNGSLLGDLHQVRIPGVSGTTVTAAPQREYVFLRWSDGSTENPRTDLKVTSDINVTAFFIDPEAVPSGWMIY